MNIWPPLACSGIHILGISDDFMRITVRLREHWWNRNVSGVHFGASLFAMTDPFRMVLLIRHLGADHVVWDQAARIDFLAPGKGDVTAEFVLDPQQVAELRAARRTVKKFRNGSAPISSTPPDT